MEEPREILDKRYMSSESSGEVRNPTRVTIRRFPWESKRLRKLKDLDKVFPSKATTTHRERTPSARRGPHVGNQVTLA
ncbi:Hypp8278 [Branchiostoma lanceolatum]|uniref:Hypp8278 protein n=1 Tax=Branchiostoma lanceolatum TaxID=7740 RepID=A0A8J9Z7V3_BRALA|nr:Hypp8278 [Branchiostoma lanceolatum]